MTNEHIKQLRIKMAMSQEDFAHLIGVKLQTVSRWELGKANPSFAAKRKLAKVILNNKNLCLEIDPR